MKNEDLIIAYNNLDLNNKRNKLNNELIVIGEYLKHLKKFLGCDSDIVIKDYSLIEDKDLTEEENLTCLYDDIYKIEKELIDISYIIMKNYK